jgi:hypothetical protein
MDEIHDVQITSIANGNILQYSSSDSLWHNVAGTTTNIAEGTNLYYMDTRARASISTTATGLTYTSGTGVLSLTAGYVIPTTTKATEWDTAYTNRITSATSPLSIAANVISIAQATTSANGYLSSTDWTTFNNKQATLSLTTTGSSGAATLISNVLNVPTYTLTGLGGVPTTRTLTINGTGYDLSADRSWTIPTNVNATFTQDYTATAAQTTFTVTGGYTVGQLAVFYNGSKLASAEFTATNGTTFVLATACQVNDIVQAVVEITGGGIGGSGTAGQVTYWSASGVTAGSSNHFWDATNNRLGLGTSTPSSPLDVIADNTTAINLRLRGRAADSVGQMEFWNNAQSTRYGYIATDSTSMGIVTTQSIPLVFGTNSAEKMRITSSGNVGIGTTSPNTGKLEISTGGNRNVVISNDDTDTGYNIVSLNGSRTKGSYIGLAGGGTGDNNLYMNSSLDISFQTGASFTQRMRITSDGLVLMNTTSQLTAGWLCISVASNNYNAIVLKDTGTSYSSSNYYQLYTNSTNGIAGGVIHSTASTVSFYTGPSDQRLKSNIKDWVEPVLPLFAAAKPKTYNHIADEDETVVYKGFLAQDMVDNFPEVYGLGADGYYQNNPTGYIPYLVKAIQEMNTKSEEQQALITSLQEQINAIVATK